MVGGIECMSMVELLDQVLDRMCPSLWLKSEVMSCLLLNLKQANQIRFRG